MKQFNSNVHYSFGDAEERGHITFPASTFFERLVATRPGETPPSMGEEFVEPASSVKARKSYKTKIDWNTEDIYSFSFYSMYLDFPSWSVVNLPVKDMNLQQFWKDSLASFVLYEQDPSKSRHESSSNKYVLSLQVSPCARNSEGSVWCS
jgi:hypothetical protein